MKRRVNLIAKPYRRGATTVEMAVILPVFGIFMAGLMETGHAYMVMQVLNSAAKQAARVGAVEGKTSADVRTKANQIFTAAFDPVQATVYVKDGASFDIASFNPSGVSYGGLPDIEVADAEPRQLFIVRIEVPYNDVAILPPFWVKNVTLSGMAVMRHE
ncbi:MAG: pilus assembly protein [Planctomycetaceae bacterium]|nr:pilus assembly protein [Planctomycetaceae bacterium]